MSPSPAPIDRDAGAARRQPPRGTGTVLLICPGGMNNSGGIGRQMGYFLKAIDAPEGPARPDIGYRILDSRGPWFLGVSKINTVFSAVYLAICLCQILAARMGAPACAAHVNIAGRGSTIRKIVLTGWARLVGVPYLLHVHDYDYGADYARRGPFIKSCVRRMFRNAAGVLVLGRRDKKALEEAMQLPPGLVTVLHNAVPDPAPLVPKPASGLPCHVLFLGYLSDRKGVPELLGALASETLLPRAWRATLAGGGDIERYQAMAVALGIADRVSFPGYLDPPAVHAVCSDADILVLPSHGEGLAMSVLEGLSHGLAVVTTPVGAHEEVIENDVSGKLVPPGDTEALASALLALIEDGALRADLQKSGRQRFLEKFDVRIYAARLQDLHADLLAGAQTARQARRVRAA
jgi:glycosyltransferase involved in cell wall biosynthesis